MNKFLVLSLTIALNSLALADEPALKATYLDDKETRFLERIQGLEAPSISVSLGESLASRLDAKGIVLASRDYNNYGVKNEAVLYLNLGFDYISSISFGEFIAPKWTTARHSGKELCLLLTHYKTEDARPSQEKLILIYFKPKIENSLDLVESVIISSRTSQNKLYEIFHGDVCKGKKSLEDLSKDFAFEPLQINFIKR